MFISLMVILASYIAVIKKIDCSSGTGIATCCREERKPELFECNCNPEKQTLTITTLWQRIFPISVHNTNLFSFFLPSKKVLIIFWQLKIEIPLFVFEIVLGSLIFLVKREGFFMYPSFWGLHHSAEYSLVNGEFQLL